jgi:small-conductance mechanosensitive channel
MDNTLSALAHFCESLRFIDYLVISTNLLLIVFARPLLGKFTSGSNKGATLKFRINLLRSLNLVILLVYAYQYFYLPAEASGSNITLLSILAILYLTYFFNQLLQYLVRRQYGKARQIGGKLQYVETYQSRLLSIIFAVLLTVVSLISIVHQLGFDSLLEAGGVLGIFGVMLGLTQASWAPDIISGLIILNSDMFEEGDIVDLGESTIGSVYKTKLFHTEILNLSNNHRVMISNAKLRSLMIHNLSKFASAKGL